MNYPKKSCNYPNKPNHRFKTSVLYSNILSALSLSCALALSSTVNAAQNENEKLHQLIKSLEQRVVELETSTVLSDPETSVKIVEVFIDENGIEHDTQLPGTKRIVTYQRQRVYRRQTINEKIDEALDDAANKNVQLGVDAAIIIQNTQKVRGSDKSADGNFYQLASTDLYFTAGLAQYTVFFADIVGLSGTPPDNEINGLTLANGYAARLINQNDLSLREAWILSELWDQKLSVVIGRVDLTNYFDSNTAANDETSQFLSDVLVNNPALGLSENGAGMAFVYDPKSSFNFKLGYQQSSSTASNLSDSLFLLAEAGYKINPFSLGEGNYRIWHRKNNTGSGSTATGVSLDQRLTAGITLFGRYGFSEINGTSSNALINAATNTAKITSATKDKYYSTGVQFDAGLGFNPEDTFGIGIAYSSLATAEKERLVESYYNLALTEKLSLTFNVSYLEEERVTKVKDGYLISGVRLQATF